MKWSRILLLLGLPLASSLPAFAGGLIFEDQLRKSAAKTTEIPMGDGPGSAPAGKTLGIGLSTLSSVTSQGALLAQFDLGKQNAIQLLVGLEGTAPIDLGVGALFRHDLDDNPVGLHVGAGAGFNAIAASFATNSIYLSLIGLGGMHFRIPGAPQVEVLADAGAVFTAGSSGTTVKIGALSSLLGLSVIYQLAY